MRRAIVVEGQVRYTISYNTARRFLVRRVQVSRNFFPGMKRSGVVSLQRVFRYGLVIALAFVASTNLGQAQDLPGDESDTVASDTVASDTGASDTVASDTGASDTGASDDAGSATEYRSVTTIDPDVPLEQLSIMVKPLTKTELEVEAEAWFVLLRSKARQIAAARLGLKKTNESLSASDEETASAILEEAVAVKEQIDQLAEEEAEALKEQALEELELQENAPAGDAPAGEGAEAGGAAEDESLPDAMSSADAAENSNQSSPADNSPQAASNNAPQDTPIAPQPELEQQENAGQSEDPQTQPAATSADEAQEVKADMLASINELQDSRIAISDRLEIVLDSLEAKGGDVEMYRRYSAAVGGVEVDTSDMTAIWTGIMGWIRSKEGGQRVGGNIISFIVVLVIAYIVARITAVIVNWMLERKLRFSQLAERLIAKTIKNVVLVIGFAVALTTLEIDVTPLLAAIGATGLVVGLALQGTLSNFASGLMILINRPFDVGDIVEAGGVLGTVNKMTLFSTNFRTFDNHTIHVPNNEVWNNVITNITSNPIRRVDMEFGIGYGDDFENAESIIMEAARAHELVLDDPAPVVVTHALSDSSVNIVCRPWVKTEDWWQVKTELTREVKRRFDAAGITIPFPQRDVHVHSAVPANSQP